MESEEQRARRLAYRARISEWQSFLDTAGRRQAPIPPNYPRIPPPPRLFTDEELAQQEAEALILFERNQEVRERLLGGRHDQEETMRGNPRFGERLSEFEAFWSVATPQIMADTYRGLHPSATPEEIYTLLQQFYAQWVAEDVPFTDTDLRAAAGLGFSVPGQPSRSSWKFWDVYIFATWEEALAFLRPQAGMLTQARRPVMVNAGGVLRAWEGTRYVTHTDQEGTHGWANIEPSRLASAIVARAAVINFEINAKFSRVEAVALYIHK